MPGGPDENFNTMSESSMEEIVRRNNFYELYASSPISPGEALENLGLFFRRQVLSRILFLHEIYQQVLEVHGVIMEFGVRWGANLTTLMNLRGAYEPFNYNRKIVGFDTFNGFPSTSEKDGASHSAGDYGVTSNYADFLESVLDYHEAESPIAHKKKFELVIGDVKETVPQYLADNEETIIALAYFDLDLYEPTKACLEAIAPRITKGTILIFDELNYPGFPGETLAVLETIGIRNHSVRRSILNPTIGYIVV